MQMLGVPPPSPGPLPALPLSGVIAAPPLPALPPLDAPPIPAFPEPLPPVAVVPPVEAPPDASPPAAALSPPPVVMLLPPEPGPLPPVPPVGPPVSPPCVADSDPQNSSPNDKPTVSDCSSFVSKGYLLSKHRTLAFPGVSALIILALACASRSRGKFRCLQKTSSPSTRELRRTICWSVERLQKRRPSSRFPRPR
jgi:hypothetical protein